MNAINHIKKCRVSYNGIQVVLIKYISMRQRMNSPVVLISEIMSFNPIRFKRKDTILRTLEVMVKNNFVKTQMSIAMAHGVTFTLCKDDFVTLSDNVINELFHTKLLQSD